MEHGSVQIPSEMGFRPGPNGSGPLTVALMSLQEKFLRILSQHFKSVPSNPHYYFYCPLSAQKEVSEIQSTVEPDLLTQLRSGPQFCRGSAG